MSEAWPDDIRQQTLLVPGWSTEVVKLAGQVMVGAWTSRTMIRRLHVAALPTWSVAVATMVWVPMGSRSAITLASWCALQPKREMATYLWSCRR